MRKTYSKPDIVFESFSLSTSVALNCETKAPEGEQVGHGAVRFYLGMVPLVVFQNSAQGCIKYEDDGEWNTFCYHNPGEFNSLFVS